MLPRGALAANPALITGADVCMLVPETTEGPFYFDPALVRRDITEGRPGLPTTLRLQVVDRECRPIPQARVDVWHTDAMGAYSGSDNAAGAARETFMRGTQVTGADGVAEFQTVYPGWYGGRTTHIHFKVILDQSREMTGQIFFPDEVSDRVYTSVEPYKQRGADRDRTNANDGIARQAGSAAIATVEEVPDAYVAALVIGTAA